MTGDQKTILKNNRQNKSIFNSHGRFMCVGVILSVVILLMIIGYSVTGVIYLSSQFKIWKECSKTNYLWPWILVSMISITNMYNIIGLTNLIINYFFGYLLYMKYF